MQPLVLITYLALVLAVAGQAVDVENEAPARPQNQQVRDVPNRGDEARDTALDHTKRLHESAEDRSESEHREVNWFARLERN